MGSNTSKLSLEKAIGNVNLPRVINPTIRGAVRRANPDGGHASPFFLGLNGKTLLVEATPVVGNITINFVSDFIVDAIATINAASPANLSGADEDGYIRLTNLNTGNKNSLKIKGGTSTTILGFVVDPEPGSVSYSGEIASSPPGRNQTSTQNNPQGTHLLSQDEDLSSISINRAIAGSQEHAQRLIRDLDREIPIVRKVSVTTITLPVTTERAFVITDPTIRFPVDGFGIAVSNPTSLLIDQLVRLKSSPDDIDVYDISQTDPVPHISKVIYNTGLIGVSDTTQTFTTWGTPDGKSVFASQLRNKQPPVAITNIRGNIIETSLSAFVTNTIQAGDTVIIESANNNTPFNHNGEFVVTEVIGETRIAVRSKGSAEKTFVTANIPTELNSNLPGGTAYGTIRVIVGSYIPGTALTFVVPSWIPNATTFFVHLYCGVRIRDLQPGDVGVRFSANDEAILTILRTHITTALSFRHHAIDVDAAAVPSSPHSLSSGTVASQLIALLGFINSTIAAEVSYAGGPAWRDGVTNPSTTVEAQLDKLISDLTGAGGAIKVGYAGGAAWADGTTNPATGVETQLDKIVTDLAASTGTAKVGGAATGTDIAAATLATQIADLAVNWLKMNRTNTIGGAQTFTQIITANGGLVAGVNQDIEISGTAVYAHGDRTITLGASSAESNYPGIGDTGASSNTPSNWSFLQPGTTTATTAFVSFPIPLPAGTRLKAWAVTCRKQTNNTHTITAELLFASADGLLATLVGSSQTNSGNSPGSITFGESGLTHVMGVGQYAVRVKSPDSSTANGVDTVASVLLTFDQPA